MKISAIISEYNPFHNGHMYQINQIRQQGVTHVVSVMSPNFVQRGDIAIFDKRTRVKAALECGVDLVLELPTPYALASARQFSFGAIAVINALGCVDEISFGSECGDIEKLKMLADFVYGEKLYPAMEKYLAKGMNFPSSRTMAVNDVLGKEYADITSEPNNILGIEYIGQIIEQKCNIKPTTVKRTVEHDSNNEKNEFASASHIRKLILEGQMDKAASFIPRKALESYSRDIKENNAPNNLKNLYPQLLYKLRTMSIESIANLPDINEGLENRIYKAVRSENNIENIIDNIKTKRYAHSRIRRILASSLLDVNANMCKTLPPYIRVLGFNERGQEILAKAKKTASLPISDSLAKLEKRSEISREFALLEALATDVYNLSMKNVKSCGEDYFLGCVIAKSKNKSETE